MSPRRVFVVGAGMTKFKKVGKEKTYIDLGKDAALESLRNAQITYKDVDQVVAATTTGKSGSGQRIVYELGLTGIPIFNVTNNGSTGATGILLAKHLIETGVDCVLVVGFDKMTPYKTMVLEDEDPVKKHVDRMIRISGADTSVMTAQIFGNAGVEHMRKYGTMPEHFAKIAQKNHNHAVNNPYAQYRKKYSLKEILDSEKVFGPLTKLQCSPISEGAAAVVLASESFVRKHNLGLKAVELLSMEMATDFPSTFEEGNMALAGYDMTASAARKAFHKAGCSPKDVQVVELHDCFSTNELISYEALGLCEEGEGATMVDNGDNTYGGKYVINPSGGLISRGHPVAATGVAQCVEIVWQLRGEAGLRQVPNAKIGLQHTLGLGGAVVVGIYRKPKLQSKF